VNQLGRLVLAIAPAVAIYKTLLPWAATTSEPAKAAGRTGACWGATLGLLSAGLSRAHHSLADQIAGEIFMGVLGFGIGYLIGWLSKKL
jgi:hypothetical protein